MKKITLTIAFLFSIFITYSQQDTTKINIDNKEIIIIKPSIRDNNEVNELKTGIDEFDELIDSLESVMEEYEVQIEESEDAMTKKKLEEIIAETEKKIQAFEDGIEQIEDEIDEIEDEIIDDDNESDQWRFNDFEKINPFKKKRKFKGHWAGFEFGPCNFFTNNFGIYNPNMSLPPDERYMDINALKSWSYAFNFAQVNIPIINRYLGIVSGLGLKWDIYELKNNAILTYENEKLSSIISNENLSKNKIITSHLTLPILIELQIPNKKKKGFFLNFGVVGDILFKAKQKIKHQENNIKIKSIRINNFDLNQFNLNATARIGYKFLQFYANYSITPLFKNSYSEKLYPVSAGLRIDF